jgi:Tol biopolymer transport system component
MKQLFLTVKLFLLFGILLVFAQSPDQLFQQALLKENGEGDLKAAVALYEKIVGDATAEKELRAGALLHIGICWEKMGKETAQKTYQRIISEFSDQSGIVMEAKTRLANLQQNGREESQGLSIRKLWSDFEIVPNNLWSISPDGKYITGTHQWYSELCMMDLESKKIQFLTDNEKRAEKFFETKPNQAQIDSFFKAEKMPMGPNWSTDGSMLAYFWCDGDGIGELRIITTEGKIIQKKDDFKEFRWPMVKGWTKKGNKLLITALDQEKEVLLLLFNISDLSFDYLKKFEGEYSVDVFFSPDEEYVVYDLPTKVFGKEIFIISLENKSETKLLENVGKDQVLGWLPDGKQILFLSDRGGTWDAWKIGVEEGKPRGEPVLVKKDFGNIFPLGISQNGTFIYASDLENFEIYLTELSADGNKIAKEPQRIADQYIGSNSIPIWSPDGSRLAYLSKRERQDVYHFIVTYSPETQEKKEYPLNFLRVESLNWDLGGKTLLITGILKKEKAGIFCYNFTDKIPEPIYLFPKKQSYTSWASWLPDGNQIIFLHRPYGEDPESKFMLLNVADGKVKELDREWSWPPNPTLHPDKKHLTFRGWFEQKEYIYQIPVTGGEREIIAEFQDESVISIAWAPDGQKIYIVRRKPSEYKTSLWLKNLQSGELIDLNLKMNYVRELQMHPDGKQLVFQDMNRKFEIWAMEGF